MLTFQESWEFSLPEIVCHCPRFIEIHCIPIFPRGSGSRCAGEMEMGVWLARTEPREGTSHPTGTLRS